MALLILVWDHGQVYHPPGESGPAILRPNGTVFATGAACTIAGPASESECLHDLQPGPPILRSRLWRPEGGDLEVVANGIPSQPNYITVGAEAASR